jgi:DNA/RNA endonuclease YhcR with UshA esterase domain
MMRKTIFIFIVSILLVSCGRREEKQEFIEENPKTVEMQKKTDTASVNAPEKTGEKKSTDEERITDESSRTNIVISPLEAKDYVGKSVNVKGYVADVHKTDKVAYLNFVERFPENPFTAVIFANRFNEFGDINKYLNKTVIVGGRVTIYRDKPQIILENKSQIKIVK